MENSVWTGGPFYCPHPRHRLTPGGGWPSLPAGALAWRSPFAGGQPLLRRRLTIEAPRDRSVMWAAYHVPTTQ